MQKLEFRFFIYGKENNVKYTEYQKIDLKGDGCRQFFIKIMA